MTLRGSEHICLLIIYVRSLFFEKILLKDENNSENIYKNLNVYKENLLGQL